MGFAENLKHLREERDLRQEDLANILQISRQAISNYEQGTRFPKDEKLLISIANFFGVTTDYLLGRDEQYIYVNEAKLSYCEKTKLINEIKKDMQSLPTDIVEKFLFLIKSFSDWDKASSKK